MISREVCLRNVFRVEDNPPEWKEVIKEFPNGVPRFAEKSDCVSFLEKYSGASSNPDFPILRHSVTTLITWEQIESYLLTKISSFNTMWKPKQWSEDMSQNNRFINCERWLQELKAGGHQIELLEEDIQSCYSIRDYLKSRLQLTVHRRLSSYSTIHTLKYLFYHMKCGIMISIRNNELVAFCPFVNRDYENTWHNVLRLEEDSVDQYYEKKSKHYRREDYLEKSKWWANGNILCTEQSDQLWGDHYLFPLKDMLSELCRCREVPDCDFFLNKRDYPQLKYNEAKETAVEPYGFIYDRDDKVPEDDVDLARYNFPTFAPIMSFYTSSRFADIPIPPSEDWEAATGEVYPPSMTWNSKINGGPTPKVRDLFTAENLKKFDKDWKEKKDIAFFRGTATGGGVTADTNQRLKVAVLHEEWKKDPKRRDYLDAKIVGWNLRDKKLPGQKMTFIRKSDFPFSVTSANFTPIYEQSSYKYLLYIEGHCAACRYGFMMVLGSVILKVESRCVADQLWYFPLLRPYHDHVPVKADLSDLAEQIEWCKTHDEECRRIAHRARVLRDSFVGKEGILDYLQMVTIEISKRWVRPLECFHGCDAPRQLPYDVASDNMKSCLEVNGVPTLCRTCDILNLEREKKMQQQVEQQGSSNEDKGASKRTAREKLKQRAEKRKLQNL